VAIYYQLVAAQEQKQMQLYKDSNDFKQLKDGQKMIGAAHLAYAFYNP
jgi:hypothetical protein